VKLKFFGSSDVVVFGALLSLTSAGCEQASLGCAFAEEGGGSGSGDGHIRKELNAVSIEAEVGAEAGLLLAVGPRPVLALH
jgi:hypothetical protein